MYELKYSEAVSNDLYSIHKYVAYKLKNPTAADRTIRTIMQVIESLVEYPKRGGKLFKYFNLEYRFLLVNNYVVVYRIKGTTIYITRVLYKRQNFLKLLLEANI